MFEASFPVVFYRLSSTVFLVARTIMRGLRENCGVENNGM
jgi:hypothetical protein